MYFDEVMNQYGNGIGVLLLTPDGSFVPLAIKLNFEATNNLENMRLVSSVWKPYES